MKEAKVRGKVWLPAYIQRNPKVQQIFHADKIKRHRNRVEPFLNKEDHKRNLMRIQARLDQIEALRKAKLAESLSQLKAQMNQ